MFSILSKTTVSSVKVNVTVNFFEWQRLVQKYSHDLANIGTCNIQSQGLTKHPLWTLMYRFPSMRILFEESKGLTKYIPTVPYTPVSVLLYNKYWAAIWQNFAQGDTVFDVAGKTRMLARILALWWNLCQSSLQYFDLTKLQVCLKRPEYRNYVRYVQFKWDGDGPHIHNNVNQRGMK